MSPLQVTHLPWHRHQIEGTTSFETVAGGSCDVKITAQTITLHLCQFGDPIYVLPVHVLLSNQNTTVSFERTNLVLPDSIEASFNMTEQLTVREFKSGSNGELLTWI